MNLFAPLQTAAPTRTLTIVVQISRAAIALPEAAQVSEAPIQYEVRVSGTGNHKAFMTNGRKTQPRNDRMLAALRQIDVIHQGMSQTNGANTLTHLREARDGALYGYEPGN
jgi:hypothetical protein